MNSKTPKPLPKGAKVVKVMNGLMIKPTGEALASGRFAGNRGERQDVHIIVLPDKEEKPG